MVVCLVRPVCCVCPVKLPNYQLPNSQLNEVRSDAAERAAGEESPERTGDERPYRFRDGLGHLEPVDFKFHVASFLGVCCCVCCCGVRCVATPQRCSVWRSVCLRICGKCRAAFRRVACCASVLSSYLSTIMRLPSGTSPSQLRAIFAPSALFPGISRRCTRRSVASTRAQRRYRVSSLP